MIADDTYRIAPGQDETYRIICDMHRMEKPADRLRRARELRGYKTPTEAAEAFGWNEITYRAHENGGRGIKPPVAERYAKALRVKASWILFDDGDEPAPDNVPPQRPGGYAVEENVVPEPGPFRRPPVTGPRDIEELGVTMGGDGEDDAAFEMNGQVIDRVKRPIGILDRKNVYALRVTNNSMWPRFKHGVRVYIEDRPPAIEDHVVIELKPAEEGRPGKSFIKLLQAIDGRKVTVMQYRPEGILEFGRNEIKKIWRVIPDEELRGE